MERAKQGLYLLHDIHSMKHAPHTSMGTFGNETTLFDLQDQRSEHAHLSTREPTYQPPVVVVMNRK